MLQGSCDKGRAGKMELGGLMGGVLSCPALAKLQGGFREAIYSWEIRSEESGASAAWDE